MVGPIGVYTGWINDVDAGIKASITGFDWIGLVLISIVLPAVFSYIFYLIFKKIGWIKDGDMKLG